jgi:hypothetical protein
MLGQPKPLDARQQIVQILSRALQDQAELAAARAQRRVVRRQHLCVGTGLLGGVSELCFLVPPPGLKPGGGHRFVVGCQ